MKSNFLATSRGWARLPDLHMFARQAVLKPCMIGLAIMHEHMCDEVFNISPGMLRGEGVTWLWPWLAPFRMHEMEVLSSALSTSMPEAASASSGTLSQSSSKRGMRHNSAQLQKCGDIMSTWDRLSRARIIANKTQNLSIPRKQHPSR